MYDGDIWKDVFILGFTAFAFWLVLWCGIWSVGWIVDLVKSSFK